jgi:predicted HTH domain antitoxin
MVGFRRRNAAMFEAGKDISRGAAMPIALELFREERISLGRAAELCRIPLEAFMDYAGRHGLAPAYGVEELEQDRRNMTLLGL